MFIFEHNAPKMKLHQKIVDARKKQGLTQEELAALSHVTVRTIQRIESGETMPRAFTLKALATALHMPFEAFSAPATTTGEDGNGHFLQLLYLSCFSYLVVPYVHFLVPAWLLRKQKAQSPAVARAARKIIRGQLYWVIALHLLLLLTLAVNFFQSAYWDNRYFIHYLWPLFAMYLVNAVIILSGLARLKP
ncbi:helix-turn-helix domain-containing protein [Chitinophaga japonensis]|uniref:Helix-turn-helix protein n=1 Tax=Chitinophaga japonensis TaxID=104662 RepID=A0A562T586_CHIJA|nr:helix-turn-helix transcriptional regulator [Chitinophaga japonensis]TWI88226.1 helix-turn-helix protein [Chitinophaga japonensis]